MKKEGNQKAESGQSRKEEADNLSGYVSGHLRNYVTYMLGQGYEFSAVEGCLLHYGYKKKQLGTILTGLEKKHHVSNKSYKAEELDKETFYYLRAIIAEYIKKQLDHGYSAKDIRAALINYGHDAGLVKDAFGFVGKTARFGAPLGIVFFLSLVLLAGFVFMLGATLGEGPAVVLVAFLPAFITITIIYGLLSIGKLKKIRKLLPILALMIVIVVYMALITRLGGSNMDFGIILALNAAAAFMLSLLMVLFSKG